MNEVFQKIIERINRYAYDIDEGDPNNDKVISESNAIKIVQEVAEEYNDGWIPVSECLPNQDGEFTDVLITCESMVDGVFVQSAEFYLASDGSLVFDALYHYNKVLAWKPLPEPYREIDVNSNDD